MEKAISVRDVGKVYHVYDNPRDRLREVLSLTKKKYYREFHALGGVSLDVGRGETVGIIGRNGSGKSTLLKIICGILKPTAGSVETRGRISALLELGTGFNPEFTGRENVYLNGALMGLSKEEVDERYQDITDFADIGGFIDQPVKTYSSGMYVRLAFSCSVNVDPDILIVDEALSVGDVFFQQKCFRKMGEFKDKGKTMIIVSHGLDVVQKNCDRAVFLDKGRLACSGASRDVINRYLESVLLKGEPSSKDRPEAVDADGGEAARQRTGAARTGDRCASRTNYNKNEFRYGNMKAAIVDFATLDKDGREQNMVNSGEPLLFRFEVVFDAPVAFPIYGLTIKTKDGVTVYGTNTWHANVPVEPKGRGDVVVVEFMQAMNLVAGDYFISAGVSDLAGENAVPVDRRYDLAYLKVLSVDRSFGVANLFSRIQVGSASVREGQ
ncbi:MAG: ABC transporter ATP-binding protein [Nitrospirae bacterium]|nr:ABC transporter ATP-binding protein [Nitrospirota bacterium]